MTLNLAQICLYTEILFVHVLFHQSSSAHGPPSEHDKEDATIQHDTYFRRSARWGFSLDFLGVNTPESISGYIRTRRSVKRNTSTNIVLDMLSLECGNSQQFDRPIQLKASDLEIFAVDLFRTTTNVALETANLLNSMHKNGGQTDWIKFYTVVLINSVNHIYINNNNDNNNNLKNIMQICIITETERLCIYVSNSSIYSMDLNNAIYSFEWYKSQFGENVTKHMNNETIMDPIKRNISYPYVNESDGKWSKPYCSASGLWIISYAVPFVYRNNSFGGVVTIDVELSGIDINQCNDISSVFSGTHECPDNSECVFIPGNGFELGSYTCRCDLGGENLTADSNNTVSSVCKVVENRMVFRTCVLALQMLCVVYVLVLIIMVRRFRRLKVVNYDSPWMIIVVLIGAILLYCEIIPMYFDIPSNKLCFLQRWLREVGFSVTFGTLVLKVYRKLAIFQTRSASRVLVRDRDLIKWILVIIFVLSGYLAVWTVSTMEDTKYCSYQMVVNGSTADGRHFKTCDVEWWDSVLGIIEFAFLMFGLYLCYLVRSAPSEFNEIKYVTLAIFDEAFVSLILYIIKFLTWDEMEPDWMFLVHFIRSQLTTTVMVSIIVLPKLVLVYKLLHDDHFRERMNSRIVYDVKWQASVKRNPGTTNDYTFGADEVREELRRLYTQLEIYKTHSMKENNPHIPSKKRSAGKRWRDTRKLSRGPSLRTQSYHSESEVERSSDVGRSTESLSKPFENMCENTRLHSLDRGESNRRKFTLDRNDPSIRRKNNSTSSDKADASFTNNRTCKL